MNYSEITEGTYYAGSSGDYRVTRASHHAAWVNVDLEPSDYRGTPGSNGPWSTTVHEFSPGLGYRWSA